MRLPERHCARPDASGGAPSMLHCCTMAALRRVTDPLRPGSSASVTMPATGNCCWWSPRPRELSAGDGLRSTLSGHLAPSAIWRGTSRCHRAPLSDWDPAAKIQRRL